MALSLRHIWQRHPRRLIIAVGAVLIVALGIWSFQGPETTPITSYQDCATAGYPIADSEPPVCNDGHHAYLGPVDSSTPAPTVVAGTPQTFEILVDGSTSGNYARGQQAIRDQAAWEQYWQEVHASLSQTPPLIPVDFTTSDVIAIDTGRQPTAGYNLRIGGIVSSPAAATVDVEESIPTISCKVAQMVTNRYLIVKTPKLGRQVSFRITTTHRHCAS